MERLISQIDSLLLPCRHIDRMMGRLYLESRFCQSGIGALVIELAREVRHELDALRQGLQGLNENLAERRLLVFLAERTHEPDSLSLYYSLFNAVAGQVELAEHALIGTPLQDSLLESFLADDNLYHRKADALPCSVKAGNLPPGGAIGESLTDAYLVVLEVCSALLHFDAESIMQAYRAINAELIDDLRQREVLLADQIELRPLPLLGAFQPSPAAARRTQSLAEIAAAKLKTQFLEGSGGRELAVEIADFISRYGRGELRNYLAFRWLSDGENGCLQGVRNYQDVRIESLVGYESALQELIDNTAAFLDGYEANNALLYGARGTGKSSSVRALLNEFAGRNLRMIEIEKSQLFELNHIITCVRERREKFIIFCDDLSFESDDTTYKAMKVVMDGTLEERAANVLFYATSNTKDLVRRARMREGLQWSEERAALDEKRGIDDRFGLKIHFTMPDQKVYRRMLAKHAELKGVREEPEELFRQFRIWCGMNNHDQPSGRTARDFMKWYVAKHAAHGDSE